MNSRALFWAPAPAAVQLDGLGGFLQGLRVLAQLEETRRASAAGWGPKKPGDSMGTFWGMIFRNNMG